MALDTLALGAAGEYLVCADLILSGYRGWQAPNSFSYDVIAEIDGRLVRISVQSTMKPRHRPGRATAKQCYRWRVARAKRLSTGKTVARGYDQQLTDLIAVVALDIRQIAYLPVGSCPSILELEAPNGLPRTGKYGPRELKLRTFADFPLDAAIKALPPLDLIPDCMGEAV